MKRFPRLQISFLDQVFSFMRVPQEERGGAIQIRQMRHRCSLETFELNLRTKKQTTLQTNFSQNQGSGGPEWQSQAAAHSYADFDQLRRAATPHTITGPKLP